MVLSRCSHPPLIHPMMRQEVSDFRGRDGRKHLSITTTGLLLPGNFRDEPPPPPGDREPSESAADAQPRRGRAASPRPSRRLHVSLSLPLRGKVFGFLRHIPEHESRNTFNALYVRRGRLVTMRSGRSGAQSALDYRLVVESSFLDSHRDPVQSIIGLKSLVVLH